MYKRGKSVRAFCMILTFIFTLNGMCSVALASEETGLKNLARGLSYEVSTPPRDVWEDTDNKELTDGVYGKKDFTDPAWQGHHRADEAGQTRTISFDLGSPKSIKRISANYLHAPEAGIRFPTKTIIEVSGDGENWVELSTVLTKKTLGYEYTATQRFFWDGYEDGIPGQPVEANMVYAQYVRLKFEIDAPWVFIDEVEIWGIDGKTNNAVDVITLNSVTAIEQERIDQFSIDGMENLSRDMKYDISIPAREEWADTDGIELTDGVYGKKDYYDRAWQGHNKADGAEREVVFDLEEPKSIKRISANFLHFPEAGIAFPSQVDIDVSMDGENWAELSEILSKKVLGYEYPATQCFFWDGDEDGIPTLPVDINMVFAQYVRIRFIIEERNWVFIDQIDIFGLDGKVDGAEMLLPAEDDPGIELPEGADYMRCGDKTSNINNIVLLYNHVNQQWKEDDIIPYLSYINENREIKDWFFDGVLYLGLRTPGGNTFDTNTQNPSNLDDWRWYLNRTFKEDGDMLQLNNAAKRVANELGEPDKKTKVFLMIPYPAPQQTDFGDPIKEGISLNFDHERVGKEEAFKNRKKAVWWYVNTALESWEANDYDNLELVGFYWVGENISAGIPNEEELVKYASDIVHEQDLKHLWIPYFQAAGYNKWEEFGFDMAILQPNYYFNKYANPNRLEETSLLARKYGMGVEIELDEAVRKLDQEGEEKRTKYKKYLDGGVEYEYIGDVLKGYYQGGKTLLACATSDDEIQRNIYADTYKFVRDKYPTDPEEPIEKEWVVAENITIGGAANMQGPNIDGGIPGIYEDDAYILGKPGAKRRLEGFKLELGGAPSDMLVVYRGHVQGDTIRPNEKDDDLDTTWEDAEGQLWKKEGFFLGRKGEKRKFEGVELKLINKDTGKEYEDYKIQYQIHVHGEGWGDEWIEDGAFAGIESKNQRIEALRLRILKWQ